MWSPNSVKGLGAEVDFDFDARIVWKINDVKDLLWIPLFPLPEYFELSESQEDFNDKVT